MLQETVRNLIRYSEGAIALEGPILAHDLRKMTVGTRTSELFCLTVFGLCQWPAIEAYTVSMSAKPNTKRPAVSGKTPLQVVHISDIHVDLSYETGASYNCKSQALGRRRAVLFLSNFILEALIAYALTLNRPEDMH